MKTAIVFTTLLAATLAQVLPLRLSQPSLYRYSQPILSSQPVYHVSHPVVHVAQPALRLAQPAIHVAQPVVRLAADARRPIAILSQSSDQSLDGSFNYNFQSEDGISASASGSVKALGPEEQAQVVQGSYSYTAPDGTPITVQYTADENGFQASGDHLPTPPPIPEAIARSLEILPRLEDVEAQRLAAKRS